MAFNINDLPIILGVATFFLLVGVLIILSFASACGEYRESLDKEKEEKEKEKDNGKL